MIDKEEDNGTKKDGCVCDKKNSSSDKVSNESNPNNDEVLSLKKKLEEDKDKYVRLLAEFDNYKKRTAREKMSIIESAEEKLLVDLLDVVDDFDRAVDVNSSDKGLLMIYSKLNKVLEAKGVNKIKVGIGDEFNGELHDAIAAKEIKDEKLDRKIIEVVKCGYMFRSKIIRFAQVVIGEYKKQ